MEDLNALQRDLVDLGSDWCAYARTFERLCEEWDGVIDIRELIRKDLFNASESPDNIYAVEDLGCGAGITIEQIIVYAHILNQLYGLNLKVEGSGLDIHPVRSQLNALGRNLHTFPFFLESLIKDGFSFKEIFLAFLNRKFSIANWNTSLYQGTAEDLSHIRDDSRNLVLCTGLLNYVPDTLKVLEEAVRIAKPGATIACTVNVPFLCTPDIRDIFSQTPGAASFHWIAPKKEGSDRSYIYYEHDPQNGFSGFPFRFAGSTHGRHDAPASKPHQKHYHISHYEAI